MAATSSPAHQLLRLRTGRGRVALLATVVASSTTMLDATIANVALPRIGEDLGAGVSGLQWVITGYLLTLASCILVGGALGDRFGRRRTFLVGAAWFALASLGCALAPSLPLLVVARALQGVGGALLAPASLALTQASFVPEDRGAAVGAWSGLGGIAAALGPLAGGWLVDGPGWLWAFLINLPLVGVSVIAARALPESRETRAPAGFDLGGAVLGIVALGGLTWALTQGPELGWDHPSVVVAAVLAVGGAVAFVVHERGTDDPLVPGVLFASRTFTVLNVATFGLYAVLGAQLFLVVYQLQVAAGWSALAAGSALVPATLLMLVGSARSGDLATRIGPRLQLTVGPLLVALGLVLLSGIGTDVSWATDVLPGAVLFGLGLVAFVAPLTATVMGAVDDDHVSTASGINNAVARTGGLVAVALIPGLSGLAAASDAVEVTAAFRLGMLLTAGVAVLAALVSAVGLPGRPRTRRSWRRTSCAVAGPPLEPEH